MDEIVCGVCGKLVDPGRSHGLATICSTSGSTEPVWGPRMIHSDCRDGLADVTGLDLRNGMYSIQWTLTLT